MHEIQTLADLWRFYGGKKAVQERFRVTRQAVEHWEKSRGLPAGWHRTIIFDLVEAGKTFDPSLFGDKERHPGAEIINSVIASTNEGDQAA